MNASDELLRAVLGTRHMTALRLQVPADIVEHVAHGIADALLAAGYRKPHTITTAEELDALPFESVIRDSSGCVLERWGGPNEHIWASPAIAGFLPRGDISFPAAVLHEGDAA